MELEDSFMYSSEGLADGYFEADEYGEELKSKIDRYGYLGKKADLTEEERAERLRLLNDG